MAAKKSTKKTLGPNRKSPPRRAKPAPLPLRSIDLIVEEHRPPKVELKGLDSKADGPVSSKRRKKLPPPRSSRQGSSAAAAPILYDARKNYFDDGEIGRGGMGAIRQAVDQRLHRQVAMKTFEADPDKDPLLVKRFIDEAQITGQLDHPNIVPVYELAFRGPTVPQFFTMKLVEGHDMNDLLSELADDRMESRNLERIVQIVIKACEAVSFAHEKGVIHRDLKPSNIMVGSHGQVYVMDWGLALLRIGKRASDPEAERQHAVGTPAYMAPEQASARIEDIDERTDVYGLGGILYAALAGKPPHAAGSPYAAMQKALSGKIKPPSEIEKKLELPPELCRIARKALAARRNDRYGSVDELRSELEQFLRGGGWLATRTYPKGAVIIEEGDQADEAYIVVRGTCEVYTMKGKKRVSLRRMGEGEVFGETVFLTGRRRLASVRAVDEVTVKVLTRDALDHELEGNSWVKSFVTVLAERFREVASKLTDLTEGLTN